MPSLRYGWNFVFVIAIIIVIAGDPFPRQHLRLSLLWKNQEPTRCNDDCEES